MTLGRSSKNAGLTATRWICLHRAALHAEQGEHERLPSPAGGDDKLHWDTSGRCRVLSSLASSSSQNHCQRALYPAHCRSLSFGMNTRTGPLILITHTVTDTHTHVHTHICKLRIFPIRRADPAQTRLSHFFCIISTIIL